MTKAEMIDMMEKIREAANSHSCKGKIITGEYTYKLV